MLQGVSLTLEEGEVLTVIGSSGNGKTTLLRCLNGLELVDSGSIEVQGSPVLSVDKKGKILYNNKYQAFGMVFQDFNLFPQYTALKNVTLAMDLHSKNALKRAGSYTRKAYNEAAAQNRQRAKELLERVGLKDKTLNYPCQLSGGQKQRVAIARALALSPKILCFDEPTSALDPELTVEILNVIRDLKAEGRTIIVVTHEMPLAKALSDKVMFMNGGVVEQFGTPTEVFEDPQSEALKKFLSSPMKEE